MGDVGILAVHGLTATPREFDVVRKYLPATFYCVTLKGHDETPEKLRNVTKEDWYDGVKEMYEAMKGKHEHTLFLGMSTGSLLLLELAANLEEKIDGVVSVSAPVYLRKRFNRIGLSVVDKLPKKIKQWDKFKIRTNSEHPECNYDKMPVTAPLEMRASAAYVRTIAHNIKAPVLLVSNVNDPTVLEPHSTNTLHGIISKNNPDVETMMLGAQNSFYVPYHNIIHPPKKYDDTTPQLIAKRIMKKWAYF